MRAILAVSLPMAIIVCAAESDSSHSASSRLLAEHILRSAGARAGLCVRLGCDGGRVAVELARQGEFIVHAVASTREATESARRYAQSRNLHGAVSVEHGSLSRLPYVDNLVNLVVVDDLGDALARGLSLDEVVRVLCPNGVAYLGGKEGQPMLSEKDLRARLAGASNEGLEILKHDGSSAVIRKKRPAEVDEWTHWLHGPECNNVSSDSLAGPPARLQWIDGPVWMTGRNVTELFADGRSFNVTQDLQRQWTRMVARDAFNGLVLWERDIEVANPRVFLAVGGHVFAVLKAGGPLVALDAATGEVARTYDVGESPQSVLYHDGHLILGTAKEIRSARAETGEARWERTAPKDAAFVLEHPDATPRVLYKPPYMVAGDGQLFVFMKDASRPPYSLVIYSLATGTQTWRRKQPGELLAYYNGVLLLYEVRSTSKPLRAKHEEQGIYHVLSAKDGRSLWTRQHERGDYHGIWDDPCYAGGLIWLNDKSKGGFVGLDPATGEERRSLKGAPRGHCGRILATERYIFGTMSVVFSLETGRRFSPGFYKNGCNVGQIPANGLVYTFPISCSCIAYLRGHVAFAPASAKEPDAERADRLDKGPAYGFEPQVPATANRPEWNTYRRDNARSGSTSEALASNLDVLWSTSITDQALTPYGRSITPPVVAEGMVFVAMPDAQGVSALDAGTGELRWRRLVGGRVEAPPTIFRGLCLFGANDGWAYCLRAADGKLVWRFRAAGEERRIMAYSRLESPWPVPGVLVEDGVAYFAGGRHGKTANGILVYAVDPFTGELLWENRVDSRKLETWYDNYVNDLLVTNDKAIFMGQLMFDLKTGEKSRTWYKRKTWSHGRAYKYDYLLSGQGRDTSAVFPFGFLHDRRDGSQLQRYHATHWYYRGVRGLLLSFTDDRIFGTAATRKMRGYVELFAKRLGDDPAKAPPLWSAKMPRGSVQALLSAGSILFVAGPGDETDPTGGRLQAYSADDGRKLSEVALGDRPVFDGMAAAGGRLCISTQGGKVLCCGVR